MRFKEQWDLTMCVAKRLKFLKKSVLLNAELQNLVLSVCDFPEVFFQNHHLTYLHAVFRDVDVLLIEDVYMRSELEKLRK